MIRVGLVGAGYWGPNLARVLRQAQGCELTSIADVNPDNLAKILRLYPGVAGVHSVEEMWDKVDAVVIATPISSHYELARKALDRGKHVLVEKPIAHTTELAHDLARRVQENRPTLMVGHTFAYSPAVRKVREQIKAGALGEVQYISLSRVNLGLYQKDVDVIWDLAVHDISILLYWLDEVPVEGTSFGRACMQRDKNDVAFVWLRFPSGIIASIEISWLSPQKLRRTCIVGSHRMITYDDTEPSEKIKIYDRGVEFHSPGTFGEFQLSYRVGDMLSPNLSNREPLLVEVEHFLDCIATGEPPLTDGTFGANVVKVLEMVRENAWHGGIALATAGKDERRQMEFVAARKNTKDYFAHPQALVDSPEIGANTRIWAFAHVMEGAHVGSGCNLGEHVFVESGAWLGNNVTVKNGVALWAGIRVEDNVFLGPCCVFTNDPNPRAYIKKGPEALIETLVRANATIGANATVVCGHTIGQYAFVAAGAVVTRPVPDFALVVGNPARQVGWMCVCARRLPLSPSAGINEACECSECGAEFRRTESGLHLEALRDKVRQ